MKITRYTPLARKLSGVQLCELLHLDYDDQFITWQNNNRGIMTLKAQILGSMEVENLIKNSLAFKDISYYRED
jgi:hypothetical protein